jgi:arylformamidase
MNIYFELGGKTCTADLSEPIDISIPLEEGIEGVNCFYAPPFETSPVVAGDFIGSTRQGGPLNFLNIKLNPHGNGTHTECVGHIAKEWFTINQSLQKFVNIARLISVYPQKHPNGDRIIERRQLEEALSEGEADALIIRTLPNDPSKKKQKYSGTNPPFLSEGAAAWINEIGLKHLLLDLPSVDREEDGGALAAHRAFWGYPEKIREDCTITELIFVPEYVEDGLYLLNIQIASFEIDVSPSKPVLYAIKDK